MHGGENITRWVGVALCEAFAVFTVVWLLIRGQYGRVAMAVVTVLLVLAPRAAERMCRGRVALPVFLFALAYAVGPMLGFCYNLYHHIAWWDKMLHVFGGVAFALMGLFLFEKFADPQRLRR